MSAPSFPPPDLAAALDGSACLGAWAHDLAADRFVAASSLGHVLALAPEEAAGVPLARVLSGVHAEDRLRLESVLHAAWETGGPFEAEFRTGGDGRLLRLMGRADSAAMGAARGAVTGAAESAVKSAAGGAVRARGLAFDLTEERTGRGPPAQQALWRINRLAEHVIAMKGLVARLDTPPIARKVDRLAMEIGFELARRLRADADRGRP